MAKSLQHVGVKGMKWGVRKAVKSAGDWARAAGTMTKNSITNPYLAERANRESIQSSPKFGTRLRRAAFAQTTKEIQDANQRVEAMKLARKKTEPVYDKDGNDVSANPYKRLFKEKGQSDKDFDTIVEAEMNPKPEKLVGKPVKTFMGTRTEAVFDASGKDISSKPFWRPFKKKGQSDKDYDKEIDDENSDAPDAIAKRKAADIQWDKQAKVQMAVAIGTSAAIGVAMFVGQQQLKKAAIGRILDKYGPVLGKMILEGKGLS